MSDDYRARKAAELLEKKRLERVAKNIAEGRTGKISGVPAYDKAIRGATPQEAMDELRKQGKVTNLEDTIKRTGSDTIGINPEVRNKSKFFNLDKKLGNVEDVVGTIDDSKIKRLQDVIDIQSKRLDAEKKLGSSSELLKSISDNIDNMKDKLSKRVDNITNGLINPSNYEYKNKLTSGIKEAVDKADDITDTVGKEASLFKNKGGFAKMLPMLGLGAAGLAGLSIANKVQAGELGEAGLEAADLATDYVPGVGQLKMAARPSELGDSELPDELMKERAVYNAARMGKNREPAVMPSEELPLIEAEDRVKKRDLDAMMQNILNRKR